LNVKRVFTITYCLALFGCNLLDLGDPVGLRIQTDKNTYVPDPSETIRLTVENVATQTVYFICTGQIYLEEIRNGEVTGTWQVHGFEKCRAVNPVHREESRQFEMSFRSLLGLGTINRTRFDASASYQLGVELYSDQQMRRLLDRGHTISNRFMIQP
jgi:hypothetical protein